MRALWLVWILLVGGARAEDDAAATRSDAPAALRVEVTEFTTKPLRLAVPANRKIRLTVQNVGSIAHDLRISDLNVATDVLQPGEIQILEFRSKEAGTYAMRCGVAGHGRVGVDGRLIVEAPTAEAPTEAASEGAEP